MQTGQSTQENLLGLVVFIEEKRRYKVFYTEIIIIVVTSFIFWYINVKITELKETFRIYNDQKVYFIHNV